MENVYVLEDVNIGEEVGTQCYTPIDNQSQDQIIFVYG